MAKPKTKEEQAEQEARLKKMGMLNIEEIETVAVIEQPIEIEVEPVEKGGKKDARLRRPNINKQKDTSTGARD